MNDECEIPGIGEIWKHKRKGTKYIIVFIENLNSRKFETRVSFQCVESGEAYNRPFSEFIEKFQPTDARLLPPLKINEYGKVIGVPFKNKQ